jgi:hypothetical protein
VIIADTSSNITNVIIVVMSEKGKQELEKDVAVRKTNSKTKKQERENGKND